jgi:hypothetical protein
MEFNERYHRSGRLELPADYFLVVTHDETLPVSRERAMAVEATLREVPTPEWVTFVDVTGARVRMRTRLVEYVRQSTAEQRALARAFWRARDAERHADPECEAGE